MVSARANFDFARVRRPGASCMVKAWLKTTPAKRSIEGLRMCVLVAPPGEATHRPLRCARDFVLRTSERKADSFFSREQGALGKFPENVSELLLRDRSVVIVARGQRLARGMNVTAPAHSPADSFQHGEVIACAYPKVTRDDLAFGFVRKNPGEESPAFASAESVPSAEAATRESGVAPGRSSQAGMYSKTVCPPHPESVATQFVVQIHIQRFGHDQDSFAAEGGVRRCECRVSCTTVRALPISQVGLPFSSSMTKRSPYRK